MIIPMHQFISGFELFLLCDELGYCYTFEIFCGGENEIIQNEPDLGACAYVVVRLARTIPRNVNHILYFDNYYATIPLCVYLRTQGI